MASTSLEDIQKELEKELNDYITEYIKNSETSGNTPDADTIKTVFNTKANEIIQNSGYYSTLNTADTKTLLNKMNLYVENVGMTAYNKSLQSHPRAVNGQQPFALNSDSKKTCKSTLSTISGKISSSMNTLLSECSRTNKVPNESQVSNYLDSIINIVILDNSDLTAQEIQYIKNNSEKYKTKALNQYNDYVKDHAVTNEMPWATTSGSGSSASHTTRSSVSEWTKTNTSYSGTDVVVTASMRSSSGKTVFALMGEAQTISYSMFEKKSPIHAIGNMNAKDYVFGLRTFAGSLIMAVFKEHWAATLMKRFAEAEGYDSQHYLVDEMAPIDLTLSFANEYGEQSRMALYGVRFYKEGIVISVNDIYTEGTYEFVAMDVDYLADVNEEKNVSSNNEVGRTETSTEIPTVPINDGGQKAEEETTITSNVQSVEVSKEEMAIYCKKAGSLSKVKSLLKEEREASLAEILQNNKEGKYSSAQDYVNAKNVVDTIYKTKIEIAKEYFKNN